MREPKLITLVRYAVLLLFAAIAIYPALNVLSVSLSPGNRASTIDLAIIPPDWTFDNYVQLFTKQPFLTWLGNSSVVAAAVTLTGVALASIAGYAFSRFEFVGRKSLLITILTTQMFPATMLLLPLYILLAKLQLLNSQLGLMIFYTSTALPFCIWQMKSYYDTIPLPLEEAARVDGCSRNKVFWHVTLPLAVPGLIVTALFSFMTAWSEYIVAAAVMQDESKFTLPLGIRSFQASMATQWGLFAAASILVSIPTAVVFLGVYKHLIAGMMLGSARD